MPTDCIPDRHKQMNRAYIWLCVIVTVVFVSVVLVQVSQAPSDQHERVLAYSDLVMQADAGRVRSVVIQGTELHGQLVDGERFHTTTPANDPNLVFHPSLTRRRNHHSQRRLLDNQVCLRRPPRLRWHPPVRATDQSSAKIHAPYSTVVTHLHSRRASSPPRQLFELSA